MKITNFLIYNIIFISLVCKLETGLAENFLQACQNNNISYIETYIAKDGDINEQDEFGANCLMKAVLNNNYNLAKFLLEKKALVNLQDKAGVTALIMASREKGNNLTELLLNFGADPNIIDNIGFFPLMHAVKINNKEMITSLINITIPENIIKPNKFGKHCFHMAVDNYNYDILGLLLDRIVTDVIPELIKYAQKNNNVILVQYLEDYKNLQKDKYLEKNKSLNSENIGTIKEVITINNSQDKQIQSSEQEKNKNSNMDKKVINSSNKETNILETHKLNNSTEKTINISPKELKKLEKSLLREIDINKNANILSPQKLFPINKEIIEENNLSDLPIAKKRISDKLSNNNLNMQKKKTGNILFIFKTNNYKGPSRKGLFSYITK